MGRPVGRLLHAETATGVVLLLAAGLALALANSPWSDAYATFWNTPVGVRLGTFVFERSLAWLVNDGLMVIFFFVVGMEIRGEIHHGELSTWKRATVPAAAALGGMLVPAALYLAIAGGPTTRAGFGVPMATDIAFAVGILALLGTRVPKALRALLLAVAVIDDLGAIVIIAVFYSSGIGIAGLLVTALGLIAVLGMQRAGVRTKWAYIPAAVVSWAGIYVAGVHPTIAGVLIGLLTPVQAWFGRDGFVRTVQRDLDRTPKAPHALTGTLRSVEVACREAVSPAERLIASLHPWIGFGILPLFALANAGVTISGSALTTDSWLVMLAIGAGLTLGKPLGVFLASWLVLRLRIGAIPTGLNLRHLVVLGAVAGVGFTMALFIAQLAFVDVALLAAAKLGVLAASVAAGLVAFGLGRWLLSPAPAAEARTTH